MVLLLCFMAPMAALGSWFGRDWVFTIFWLIVSVFMWDIMLSGRP